MDFSPFEIDAFEEWRDFPDFEDRYEISSLGRVRSKLDGRIVYQEVHQKTYMRVAFGVGGKTRRRRVHAAVLTAFVGPRPPGKETRHLDGNGCNNRLHNLAWGTPKENADDQEKHGRRLLGEAHPDAVFTATQAAFFRDVLRTPAACGKVSALARVLGVDGCALRKLRDGKTWKHLTGSGGYAHVPSPFHVDRITAAKLTEADVRAIRASPEGCRRLARRYGVDQSTIHDAKTGKTWKHIGERPAE